MDLTWSSPPTFFWRVLSDVETLSDHLYIETGVDTTLAERVLGRCPGWVPKVGRWALRTLDGDKLVAAAMMAVACNDAMIVPGRTTR